MLMTGHQNADRDVRCSPGEPEQRRDKTGQGPAPACDAGPALPYPRAGDPVQIPDGIGKPRGGVAQNRLEQR